MMKKFLMALAATTMIATPIMSAQAQAQSHHSERVVRTTVKEGPRGHVVKKTTVVRKDNGRRWAKGQRFDRRYATHYTVIKNPRAYRLRTPARGQQWVRSGNDAVLIAIGSGIVGAVIANSFR
ncbi:RcnB family protein [Sphingobium sp. H39-3-25]|uniref:RcnB family protein n=1 Tax=Sphingobium arseniciresistens TaxID=3030834 RepID=UPI0023B8C133|nr:RcnB family protein [Sphingobium arseniciresistens]